MEPTREKINWVSEDPTTQKTNIPELGLLAENTEVEVSLSVKVKKSTYEKYKTLRRKQGFILSKKLSIDFDQALTEIIKKIEQTGQ